MGGFSKSKVLLATRVGGVLLAGLAVMGAIRWREAKAEETLNFRISFPPPATGWKEIPHGPQSLFLYQHKQSKILLRGAVNQVVSDINPTPDLKTDQIAEFYIDRTKENMPDWTAVKLGTVDATGTKFRLIKRVRQGKTVVTAFAVKGNTTLLVSLSGNDSKQSEVDLAMDDFSKFLAQVGMKQESMARL